MYTQMSVAATKRALSVNTILIYASAPSFPQGIIDPISELSVNILNKTDICNVIQC
jgi:sphinganine-1-phosphate aldolase